MTTAVSKIEESGVRISRISVWGKEEGMYDKKLLCIKSSLQLLPEIIFLIE